MFARDKSWGLKEKCESDQNVQTSNYNINKF